MSAHSQMFETIVYKLKLSQLPEYYQSDFTASQRLFRCSGRSFLTEGTLPVSKGETINVMLKRLNYSYGVGNTSGRNREEYKAKLLGYFERELDIWKRTGNHPNIATIQGFMGSFREDIFPALVFLYYPLGDLRTYIEDNEDTAPKLRLQLLRDVACGLFYLHRLQPPVVHRDLIGTNILLKSAPSELERITACISDFGSSKLMDPTLKIVYKSTDKSSEGWEPPEYFHPKTYLEGYANPQPSADVWSFGCTFLEVLTGRDPWPQGCNYKAELANRKHPKIPDSFQGFGYDKFLKRCWKKSPKDRATIQDILIDLNKFISQS